jgi:hypothetical protein
MEEYRNHDGVFWDIVILVMNRNITAMNICRGIVFN